MRLVVDQTLHGYDEGHRLLASSARLDDGTLGLLDRLTDLSGYLPPGLTFDRYLTGYPLGARYVLATTWEVRDAPRRGTVVTHSLLLPLDTVGLVPSLSSLDGLFHRPLTPNDQARQRTPLEFELPAIPSPSPAPLDAPLDAVLALLGSMPERPVVCVEADPLAPWIDQLWQLLWPEARASLAFCTMALGQRRLPQRPFDLLVTPPSARSSFTEVARLATWHDPEAGVGAVATKELTQPWARSLREGGPARIDALMAWCTTRDLPRPTLAELRALSRLVELGSDAARVTTARARADLLRRLWRDLPAIHPASREVLGALLAAQPTALEEPKAFWEMQHFLKRPEVVELAAQDEPFAAEVRRVILPEALRRLRNVDGDARVGRVVELFSDAAVLQGWRSLIVDASLAAYEVEGLVPAEVCASTLRHGVTEVFLAALRQRSPDAQGELVRSLVQGNPTADLGLGSMMDALERDTLPWPRFVAMEVLRGEEVALAGLTASPDVRETPERAMEVLSRLGAHAQWRWATTERDPLFVPVALRVAAEAARALHLSPREVAAGVEGLPGGEAVFVEHLQGGSSYALQAAFDAAPRLVERAVVAMLTRSFPGREAILREVVAALPTQVALDRRFHAAWRAASDHTPLLIALLGPRIVRGTWDPAYTDAVGPWLDDPQVRAWIASLTERPPEDVPYALRREALSSASEAVRRSLTRRATASSAWVFALLRPAIRTSERSDFERAGDDLAQLLDRLPHDSSGSVLAAEVLASLRYNQPKGGYALVQHAFPRVYPPLAANLGNPFETTPWSTWSWDKAQWWRHWLLDTWVDRSWPAAAFLHCLQGDTALFLHIARRAWREGQRARMFILQTPHALRDDPSLVAQWSQLLSRIDGDWEPWD